MTWNRSYHKGEGSIVGDEMAEDVPGGKGENETAGGSDGKPLRFHESAGYAIHEQVVCEERSDQVGASWHQILMVMIPAHIMGPMMSQKY